ncbi:MAG: FIST N-terminal domain-containing protein [Myxococcaceae bacterium]|nr:FIST N-terminal domain-containing protein [Myxococcaceae bacterium]
MRAFTFFGPMEPTARAREVHRALATEPLAVVFVFGAPELIRAEGLAQALQSEFGDVPVVGCSTAGEVCPSGYVANSLTVVGLTAQNFVASVVRLDAIDQATFSDAQRVARLAEDGLRRQGQPLSTDRSFALLLTDGVSLAEERLTMWLQRALGEVPLVGGSAGDALSFKETHVLSEGRLWTSAALLVCLRSQVPFRIIRTQHFRPTERKLVVTAARPRERLLLELDGLPAAQAFAQAIDVPVERLTPAVFARHALLVRMGGEGFVRSIRRVEPNDALSTYCAIEEGLVLTLGRGEQLVEGLEAALDEADRAIGPLAGVLTFDCILRRLEVESSDLGAALSAVCRRFNLVGFSTYGEQTGAVHVNQTFTGVALGQRR